MNIQIWIKNNVFQQQGSPENAPELVSLQQIFKQIRIQKYYYDKANIYKSTQTVSLAAPFRKQESG